MITDAKPFVTLLRRASTCRYKNVVMNNRMLMQCYNTDEDSEAGLHYILMIPPGKEYESEFYDSKMILCPAEILRVYGAAQKEVDAVRKERALKPKDLKEEVALLESDEGSKLKFLFYVSDELVKTAETEVVSPFDENDPVIENIERTLQNLLERIKLGGACLLYDGLRLGLYDKAMDCPGICFYSAKFDNTVVRLPLMRSMFVGMKKLQEFLFSVQETVLPGIFIYTLKLTKDGISEIFYGYVIQF